MSSEPLHPNVQDLQQDVINLLNKIEGLMHRVSTLLSSDGSGKKYAEFQKGLLEARQNVEDLELVMAIVAPMKAGKSTIINAIVGQDLLPSRASAMTTLPTQIFLRSNELEPALVLEKDTLLCLQNTLAVLRNKIQGDGTEQAVAKMVKYPHLAELIPKIQGGISIHPKTIGLEEIKETLTDLNDIVRVCTVLAPTTDPLNQEKFDVPCIDTPFWKATNNDQGKLLGNLVIVDTPGPNEAGENLRLSAVVAEQLRKSSMVLIVLDFTQLNNKAAEEIKRQVQPVVQLLGKENLYVLVNKVDQRTEQDPMTSEKVKQFVLADLGLGESSDAGRVFEVAARWAFCAAHFLSELEHNPNIQKEQMKTARALAEQVFGIDWEEDLENCPLDQLKRKAQRLWKKSGFEPFLENAISVLMESAAPRCIKSALNLSLSRLEELKDDVQLRSSAIAKDEEKLRLEVGALEEDLNRLEVCRNRLKEVDKIRNNLQKNLDNLLEELKSAARVSLKDYFEKEESERSKEEFERSSFIQKIDIKLREGFRALESLPEWWSDKAKSNESGTAAFKFNSKHTAEEFANQAVSYAQQRADLLLLTFQKRVTVEIEGARVNLLNFLDKETRPIIERARTRLQESFDVDLSLPSPSINASTIFLVNPHIKQESKTVPDGYDTRTHKERRFLHTKWRIPVVDLPVPVFWTVRSPVETKVKRPDKQVNYYVVSLSELVTEFNNSLENTIDEMNKRINNYLDEDFQQRIDVFFASLDHYLRNYCDSLKQAQEDQQLAVEDKKMLVNGLNSLVPEASEQIKKCRAYAGYAESLLRGK